MNIKNKKSEANNNLKLKRGLREMTWWVQRIACVCIRTWNFILSTQSWRSACLPTLESWEVGSEHWQAGQHSHNGKILVEWESLSQGDSNRYTRCLLTSQCMWMSSHSHTTTCMHHTHSTLYIHTTHTQHMHNHTSHAHISTFPIHIPHTHRAHSTNTHCIHSILYIPIP